MTPGSEVCRWWCGGAGGVVQIGGSGEGERRRRGSTRGRWKNRRGKKDHIIIATESKAVVVSLAEVGNPSHHNSVILHIPDKSYKHTTKG